MQFFNNLRKPQEDEDQLPATPPKPLPAPPPRAQAPQFTGFETVLGASTVIEGSLSCSGNIRLDGKFNGTLKIKGNVLVGDKAHITADINAENISIAGHVHGNVSGKKIQLLRTARVIGDISAVALSTEEGAIIEGKVSMTDASPTLEIDIAEDTKHD